ncbi:MAG: hypothetical protein J6Y60_01050 [Treponema sp.]|nr:hypothetical protein [Treponema sp.]
MKRFFSLIFCLALSCSALFAQSSLNAADDFVQQILFPKIVYVGDQTELQFTFNSPVDFFAPADPAHINGDTLYIDPSQPEFFSADESFTVKQVALYRNGMSYTLQVSFIPWKPGVIDIPSFNLNACIIGSKTEDGQTPETFGEYRIDLQPFTVESLSQKSGDLSLRPPSPPILLPGTNYVLWTVIIAGIIFLFLITFLLARIRVIQEFYYTIREKLGLMRNSHVTRRKLKRLLDSQADDVDFASSWQRIVRSYLEYRFGCPFGSVTASHVAGVINNATGNMLSDNQESAVMDLVSLFTRTDYIVFAQGSIDSRLDPPQEHEAAFAEGERMEIIKITDRCIVGLEAVNEETGVTV